MSGLNAIYTKPNGEILEPGSEHMPPGMYHALFQAFTEEPMGDGGTAQKAARFVVLAGPAEANL